MIEKKLHLADLFAVYGPLLTEKQQEVLALNLDEDYSLGEIAELLFITRQAVNDVVKKAEKIMESYEMKLGLIDKVHRQNQLLKDMDLVLGRYHKPSDPLYQALRELIEKMQDL